MPVRVTHNVSVKGCGYTAQMSHFQHGSSPLKVIHAEPARPEYQEVPHFTRPTLTQLLFV